MENHSFSPREIAAFEGVLALAANGANLARVKVQDIADAANMGKGTLYEYFPSKEDILRGTMLYCIGQELARLEALQADCADFDSLISRSFSYVRELIREPGYDSAAATPGTQEAL